MLETLSRGFRAAKQKLSGVAELTEDNLAEALRPDAAIQPSGSTTR